MDVNFRGQSFAIVSDLRSPYTSCGIHPEWRNQFIHAINNPRCHDVLVRKLARFGPFVICYTKITPLKDQVLELVGYPEATVCVISSVGEHNMTPWMIIHNVGHTIISWNMWVKRQIKELLGLHGDDYQVAPRQRELVDCASARNMQIPNINELIYELYTTWVWHGRTKSGHTELAAYCDRTFADLMSRYKNTMFWHRYRCPTSKSERKMPWLRNLIDGVKQQKAPIVPGVPGYTTKVLAKRHAN